MTKKHQVSCLKRQVIDASDSVVTTVSVGKVKIGGDYIVHYQSFDKSMDNKGAEADHKNSGNDAEGSRRGTHHAWWVLAAVVVLAFTLMCVVGFCTTNLTDNQINMIFSIWEKIFNVTF